MAATRVSRLVDALRRESFFPYFVLLATSDGDRCDAPVMEETRRERMRARAVGWIGAWGVKCSQKIEMRRMVLRFS